MFSMMKDLPFLIKDATRRNFASLILDLIKLPQVYEHSTMVFLSFSFV